MQKILNWVERKKEKAGNVRNRLAWCLICKRSNSSSKLTPLFLKLAIAVLAVLIEEVSAVSDCCCTLCKSRQANKNNNLDNPLSLLAHCLQPSAKCKRPWFAAPKHLNSDVILLTLSQSKAFEQTHFTITTTLRFYLISYKLFHSFFCGEFFCGTIFQACFNYFFLISEFI